MIIIFRFIGEETASSDHQYELTNDPTWIVDPIGEFNYYIIFIYEILFNFKTLFLYSDGTTNFVHG